MVKQSGYNFFRVFRELLLATWFLLGGILGCKDEGTAVVPPNTAATPLITSVIPDSAAVGDTIRIVGNNFGATKGTSSLSIGGQVVATSNIIIWIETEIRAIIPPGLSNSNIVLTVNGIAGNPRPYTIKGFIPNGVSFNLDVKPILLANCALSGCHVPPTPTGAFDQTTYTGVRAGSATFGTHAVTPGDSSYGSADVSVGSGIMKMIRNVNNPYGNYRMPQGGPFQSTGLPDSLIVKIGKWIAQGAQNN